jgi:hypothetical protein
MTAALERQAIAQPLATYVAANGNIPVEWPNKVFTKPAEGITWIRFTVLDQLGKQLEMGSPTTNTNRTYGSLILQVFAPGDQGDGEVLQLCDKLGALYRQQILNFSDSPPSGMVRMRNPTIKEIGLDGAYWQVNVTIPFHRDDVPTSGG